MKCFACKRENLGRGVGRAAVLCLLLMLLCVSASAANVCAVNGTEYATLSEGLSAAQSALSNGAVRVTLLADARLEESAVLGGANRLTIDGAGKTVTIAPEGALRLKGKVSVLGAEGAPLTLDGQGAARTESPVFVEKKAALTMEYVSITGMSVPALCFGEESAADDGSLNIPAAAEGVTFADYSAMSGAEQGAFQKLFPSVDDFFAWLAKVQAEHEDNDLEVGDGGSIDLDNLGKSGSTLKNCVFSANAADIRINSGAVTLGGSFAAEKITLAKGQSVTPDASLSVERAIGLEGAMGAKVLGGDCADEKIGCFTAAADNQILLADGTLRRAAYIAKVGETKYEHLADAFAATANAASATVIELFGDEDFPAAVTLKLNRYTQIKVSADSVLSGKLTIDGEGLSHAEPPFLVNAGVALTLDGVTVKNVVSEASKSGVFRVLTTSTVGEGTLVLDGATFQNCKAQRGVVYGQAGSVFSIRNCTFEANEATASGGAIYIYGRAKAEIEDTAFVGNKAAQHGGAMYLASAESTAVLTDCLFTNNTAAELGGAVCVNSGALTASGVTISGNAAPSGKGVYLAAGSFALSGAVSSDSIGLADGCTVTLDGELTLTDALIPIERRAGEVVLSGSTMHRHSGKFTDAGGKLTANPRTGMLVTENQNYIIDFAAAYYEKAIYTQYEMQKMVELGNVSGLGTGTNIRREIYAEPGEISADEITYFDCSGFLHALYENSFGDASNRFGTSTKTMMEKAKAATSVGPDSEVVYLYEKTESGTLSTSKVAAIANDMRALLEPGDIIVYRRTVDTGHTLVYMGDGYTLESGGGSYDFASGEDTVEEEGTLALRVADKYLFSYSSSRCPMSKSNFASIAILRPLNGKNLSVSEMASAQSRNSGLSVTKRGLPVGRSVAPNGEITYTITLDNAPEIGTSFARSVTVTDQLSDKVTLVSASDGGVLNGTVLTFADVPLAKNAVKTLSYTVRVKEGAVGAVEGTTCSANGVTAVCREVLIGTGMTEAQRQALDEALAAGKAGSVSALSWINSVYKTALGKNFDVKTDAALFNAIFEPFRGYYALGVDETKAGVATALVRSVTGGYHVSSRNAAEHRDRIRYVDANSFQYGDVFATQTVSGDYVYYIYVGADKPFIKVSNSSIGSADIAETMEKAMSFAKFALLRPAMMQNAENAVAKLGDDYFATLEEALAAAAGTDAVDDVYLLGDISYNAATTLTFDGKTRIVVDGVNLSITGPVTFDGGSVAGQCLPLRVTGAGKLTLDGVTVQNFTNTRTDDSNNAYGAAIRVDSGSSLTLNDVTVKNCVGQTRGALYVNTTGTVNITASRFEGNRAVTGYGGAIALYAVGEMNVTGTDFIANSAADDGSAIRAIGTVNIEDCLFEGNALTGASYGTIRNDGAALTVKNTRIVNNTSSGTSTGIGIHHNSGTLTLDGVTATGNVRPGKTNYQDIAIRDTVTLRGENTVDRLTLSSNDVLSVSGTLAGSIALLGAAEGTAVLTGAAADVAASAGIFTVLDADGAATKLKVGADGVIYLPAPAAAAWSVSDAALSVTLNESAQEIVHKIIFVTYTADGQQNSAQVAVPESGSAAFARGAGEGKLFFLDKNGIPVLNALSVE